MKNLNLDLAIDIEKLQCWICRSSNWGFSAKPNSAYAICLQCSCEMEMIE